MKGLTWLEKGGGSGCPRSAKHVTSRSPVTPAPEPVRVTTHT